MVCQEFATAAAHDIPVKVFLMNDGHFGMVRQWQELFWDGRYSSVEMGPSPDWPKLAEAFGWTGMQCTDKSVTATQDKIDSFERMVRPHSLVENGAHL